MSTEFIKSQMDYYGRNLRCGPSRDWNTILGLYHYYQGIYNMRLKQQEANDQV